MFGRLFSGGWSEPRYIRRTRVYLQEARMAMLEHSIAAEHYQASAEMYAERARRLEEKLQQWEAVRDGKLEAIQPKYTGLSKLEAAAPAPNPTPMGIVRAA